MLYRRRSLEPLAVKEHSYPKNCLNRSHYHLKTEDYFGYLYCLKILAVLSRTVNVLVCVHDANYLIFYTKNFILKCVIFKLFFLKSRPASKKYFWSNYKNKNGLFGCKTSNGC